MDMRGIVTLALCGLAAGPVLADEVEDQVGLALEYYQEGDLDGAITELQFAINEIRQRLSALYGETFPPAPAGWQAGEIAQEEGAAFMGGGSMVTRTYAQDGGSASIEAQLMIDNPMIQGMAAMFANPAMLAAQPNMERVRIGRDNAVLNTEPGNEELTFMLGGRGMIQLSGNNLESTDLLVEMLKSWDLDALKDVAGL